MRIHFSKKDTCSKLTEMSNSVQSVKEWTYDFVVRIVRNRKKVLIFVIILAIILILAVKKAFSHCHASGPEKTLPQRNFERCSNCTVSKSKLPHCSVCVSEDHKTSACPHKD